MAVPAGRRAAVYIPTYNEALNIERLVREIHRIEPALEILVVDDQSPDGTAEIVRRLQPEIPQLHLLVRNGRRGRGLAGVDGFQYWLDRGVDFIVEMDADFSHHPRYLPDFLREIGSNDIVLGSRFVPGGDDTDRGPLRHMVTRLAGTYIRAILGIKIKDATSGYRCFRREVLEALDIRNTISLGPGIVQELLYKALLKGFHVKEIPIVFVDRKRGQSTFNIKIALQGIFMVLILRYYFSRIREKEMTIDS